MERSLAVQQEWVGLARFCRCGALVVRGKCKQCDRDGSGHEGSSAQRGYGYDWRKLRERILDEQPTCVDCEKEGLIATPATEVHHIKTIAERPDLRLEPSNLAPLCQRCHERRHGKGWGHKKARIFASA